MIEEENQLKNAQRSETDTSEDVQQVESETMPDEATVQNSQEVASEFPTAESELEEPVTEVVAEPVEAEAAAQPVEAEAESLAIAELTQQIESLKAQVEERTGQYMRIAADFDNFRKRTQKEKEDLEQQVKCSTIVELLPVVDNFERARSQIKPQTDQEMNIHKSYQSVYKQLVDCLKRVGVAPMRSEGKEFDPNLHEAVMREATDEQPEGTVIEELVRGYLLGERVLRHAMVKVATAPEPVITSDEDYQGESDG
ncbi:MAG: nucleotide exchange factor GrpE [Leptolyngbyaceae cyanobacterium SL_5_9]|nr:nucleotide exchange factor GrpE [Leptolyngbyaceae cyanobacterium SL_5_9]NJO73848.1 nucleotide exchange factor GrpE [Leptolyngbyaceae cyanobacterium RM1_406_9]